MHDKGNEENVFDRLDFQISPADSLHLNLGFTRSWFQTPNSFDQQNATAWSGLVANNGGLGTDGLPVGPADQRSQSETLTFRTFLDASLLNSSTVFTLGAFVRRDHYNYYPSDNPFADLSPALQSETVGQDRTLTNAGVRSNVSYVKGIHNLKAGAVYEQTFLNERDSLGIVDTSLNAVCFNADGSSTPNPSITSPAQCGTAIAGGTPNPDFNPLLLPYDLTRGGGKFSFHGHTDVKQLALYLQDTITQGSWSFNLGVRGDFYNGLTTHREAEPRAGIAYNVKPTGTVLRVSYARVLETPFNENLVLSMSGAEMRY